MRFHDRRSDGDARRGSAPKRLPRLLVLLLATACSHAPPAAPTPAPAEPPPAAPVAAAPRLSLTVLPVVSKNLGPSVASMVTSVLTTEAHAAPGCSVVTVDDLNAQLTLERQKDLLNCSDEKCVTEIGGALGVDRILAASAGAIGKTLVLQLTLIQTSDGKALARVYESAAGPVDLLIPMSRRAVHRLFELPGPPPELPELPEPTVRAPAKLPPIRAADSVELKTGGLNVNAVSPNTTIRVSGPRGYRFEGTLPWLAVALTPGEYALRLAAPGMADKEVRVNVGAGDLAGVIVQLDEATAPHVTTPPVATPAAPAAKPRTETTVQVEQPDNPPPAAPSKPAVTAPSRQRWLRCPVGQVEAGGACKGKAKNVNWESAQSACPAGYRLPAADELLALLDCSSDSFHPGNCQPCGQSAACKKLFGDDRGSYWTSVTEGDEGTVVSLVAGMAEHEGKDFGHEVRCVKR